MAPLNTAAAVAVCAIPSGPIAHKVVRTTLRRNGSVPAKPMVRSSTARGSGIEQRPSRLTPTPDHTVRDGLVLEHLGLARAVAIRLRESLPQHVDLDDLINAGIMGLFDAASKYNPHKQVAFPAYAKYRIKGAILDSLRQLDWASRDMRRRHKQVEVATRELATSLQRNPTVQEISQKLGLSQERWRVMMLDLRNVGLISASTHASGEEDLPAPEFPCAPDSHPDVICAAEQLRGHLDDAMKTLPERYQQVVSMYYSKEMTMKDIGCILGVNESRVSQIHKSALEKMQIALELSGIISSHAF